ncbi:hypothetical protein JAO10_01090 [Burkholderia contaminans]|uniref:terminase small subunit-like protein n=1 Tax=Burkholderia contaminans TaxID=488447 RepID=UPI0018DCCD31|nr:hypothetical protein [Burkholderia contaminans]MBH9718911.1 hypothetical protein [Burkholderia contaminans]
MAGSPIKRAKLEELDAQEELIFALIEDGKSLLEVAAKAGCSRSFLMKWLKRTSDREQRFNQARITAGDALADDIQASADNILQRAMDGRANKTEVAAAKLAGDTKRWLAGAWNPKYRDDKGANVSVNVDMGAMFLQALRAGAPARNQIERAVEPVTEVRKAINTLDTALPDRSNHIEDVIGVTHSNLIPIDYDSEPVQKRPPLDFILDDD